MSSALSLRTVDAFYDDSHVLHGIDMTLRDGTLLALLGRNGAGKTTTLLTVMGFVPVRRGTITLFGEAVQALPPESIARRGIGLVPQGRRVFPSLTVRENLLVARQTVRGGAWTLDRVFATFPRLLERSGQGAGSLSGGEQQMLAIGRALMARPLVLLLDEPSLGLSPLLTREIFAIVKRINTELHTSILVVEQNAAIALATADDGYIMELGRVVAAGTCAELMAKDDVKEFYLGGAGHGAGEDGRRQRWKRRKTWR